MPPARFPALLAIGTLIAPKARLAGELEAALKDPEDYVDDHAKELAERGIDEPVDHLPWVALVRGLVEAQAVATLPGHGDAETVRRSIEALEGCPRGAFSWMKHDAELAERSTEELLELTGKALLGKGAQLVQLDGDADHRWLAVIPRADAGELVKLGKAAGYRRIALFTGAGLIKATKDRARTARRASQTSARNAKRPAPTRRYFARGKETWTISVTETEPAASAGKKPAADAGTMFETCYEKPRVLYYVHHHFDDAAARRAGQKRLLAEWEAAGFREVDQATFEALPHAGTPYINWTAPFPDDASYVVEGKEIVRCTELRGDAVIQTAGTIGYNFGELQTVYHCKTEGAAARRYAQHVAADAHFPALSRAEVVKRYR
jgi:hypothetical protein